MAAFYPDDVNKRILVRNIPPTTTCDKLVIHFQKKKYGGCGDVISITFPKSKTEPDQAVVEFEDRETVKSVLRHQSHIFGGHQLDISEFPVQPFGRTEVIVSNKTMNKLHSIRNDIEESTGVVFCRSGDKPCIKGQWYQVIAAIDRIKTVVSQEDGHDQSVAMNAILQNTTNQLPSTLRPQHKDSQEKTDNTRWEVEVDDNSYAYMKMCHSDVFKTISRRYKVNLQDEGSKVVFTPNPRTNSSDAKGASESFRSNYSRFCNRIKSCELDLQSLPNATDEGVEQAIKSLNHERKFHVGRTKIKKRKSKLIFLAMSKADAENGVNTFRDMFAPETNIELASCKVFKTGLKVVVIHGDYHREKTEALLSEVNPMGKGRILSTLGEYLQKKVGQWAPLAYNQQHPNVYPTGGDINLGCERIFHYVLHPLASETDLEEILLKCLEYASDAGFRSIALPADCIGCNIQSQDLGSVVSRVLLKFVTTKLVKKQGFSLSEVRLISANLSDAQRLADSLHEVGNLDTSSEAGASSSVSQSSRKSSEKEHDEDCPICLDKLSVATCKSLPCSHTFHQSCIDKAFSVSKKCPLCMKFYGQPEGTQPRDGTMISRVSPQKLPGYDCDTIVINYNFRSGIQGPEHPNPGQHFSGTSRTAYLPHNEEGRQLLLLLRKAFEARLVFTVGRSVTTGVNNCVTWNDIHHKTNTHGGATGFGYPDPTYLTRLKGELADKGITS